MPCCVCDHFIIIYSNCSGGGLLSGAIGITSNTSYTANAAPVTEKAAEQLRQNLTTTGDGIYIDHTESGRYIYRGANPDNYITFNSELWRIISVEADGALKIIKNESIGDMAIDTENSRVAEYCNDSSNGCNVWGSSTTMLSSSGNNITSMPREIGETAYALPVEEASLNVYLNGEYYNTLVDANLINKHVFNTGLLSFTAEQTLATDIQQEQAYKWRGNIGLISATDYVRASTNMNCTSINAARTSPYPCKENNYLYNGSFYWTMTPFSYSSSYSAWRPHSDGRLGYFGVTTNYGVRPTLHLTPSISLTGTGTSSDPYTISPYTPSDSGNVNITTKVNSAIALSIPSDLHISASPDNQLYTNDLTGSIGTNNPTGYTLTLSSKTNDTSLTYTNPNNFNTTFSISSADPLTHTSDSPKALLTNTWGYNKGTKDSTTTFSSIPSLSSPDTIAETTTNSQSDPINLTFGTVVNTDIPAGTYMNTVEFSGIANYVPEPAHLTTVSPDYGDTGGGESITISGYNLDNTVRILIGHFNKEAYNQDPLNIYTTAIENMVDCLNVSSLLINPDSRLSTATCTTPTSPDLTLPSGGYLDIVVINTDGYNQNSILLDKYYASKQVSTTDTIVTTNQAVNVHPILKQINSTTVSINGTYAQDGTPSPDDPKDISVVEGDESGNVTLRLTGKNLTPWPYYHGLSYTNNGITFTVNEDRSVHAVGTATDIANYAFNATSSYYGPFPAGTYRLSDNNGARNPYHVASATQALDRTTALTPLYSFNDSAVSEVVTYDQSFYIKNYYIRVPAGETVDTTIYFQLETGTEATEYSPPLGYTDTTINLQGNFLASLPNGAKDTIDIDASGNIVLTKRVGKVVYDGSDDETWVRVPTVSGDPYYRFYTNAEDYNLQATGNSQVAQNILSDRLPIVSATDTYNETEGLSSKNYDSDTGTGFIIYTPQQTATVSGFRTWLTQYPVTTYYQLAEPYTVNLGKINPITLPEATSNVWAVTDLPTTVTVNYTSEQ